MTTPAGSEPTGLTFSPDFKYGFISLQNASGANTTQTKDAAGNNVVFNTATTIVFARNQFLGKNGQGNQKEQTSQLQVYPNPFQTSSQLKVSLPKKANVTLEVYDMQGVKVETLTKGTFQKGEHVFQFNPSAAATEALYLVRLLVDGQETTFRIIRGDK
jgi:hypothetical protein